MKKNEISIPGGMRDFLPQQVIKRKWIFDTIRSVFVKYGYVPIETPALEKLSIILGKYGEEGDKLLYSAINSGTIHHQSLDQPKSLALSEFELALRYDLTVPFARFVVMNQNELTFPFKRHQIQNVWRADRPQKGRYREFYQCDADVVGSDSLIHEAELVLIYKESLQNLGLKDFTIRFNHRKLLNAITERAGVEKLFQVVWVVVDKLDKIGIEGVTKELLNKGISNENVETIKKFICFSDEIEPTINFLTKELEGIYHAESAIEDINALIRYLNYFGGVPKQLQLDLSLARGLDYYTGTIFEVGVIGYNGSIGGGGRYDNLTGSFGLKGISGVGISFGADRIYDVLESSGLLDSIMVSSSFVLFVNFSEECLPKTLEFCTILRSNGIPCDIYHQPTKKLAKQFAYADKNKIPYVVIIGEEELKNNLIKIKEMKTGYESSFTADEALLTIKSFWNLNPK